MLQAEKKGFVIPPCISAFQNSNSSKPIQCGERVVQMIMDKSISATLRCFHSMNGWCFQSYEPGPMLSNLTVTACPTNDLRSLFLSTSTSGGDIDITVIDLLWGVNKLNTHHRTLHIVRVCFFHFFIFLKFLAYSWCFLEKYLLHKKNQMISSIYA